MLHYNRRVSAAGLSSNDHADIPVNFNNRWLLLLKVALNKCTGGVQGSEFEQ